MEKCRVCGAELADASQRFCGGDGCQRVWVPAGHASPTVGDHSTTFRDGLKKAVEPVSPRTIRTRCVVVELDRRQVVADLLQQLMRPTPPSRS
jgi:hypothetical protein